MGKIMAYKEQQLPSMLPMCHGYSDGQSMQRNWSQIYFVPQQGWISHVGKRCLVQSLTYGIYRGILFPGQSVVTVAALRSGAGVGAGVGAASPPWRGHNPQVAEGCYIFLFFVLLTTPYGLLLMVTSTGTPSLGRQIATICHSSFYVDFNVPVL